MGGLLEGRPVYVNHVALIPFSFLMPRSNKMVVAEIAEDFDSVRRAALAENDKLTMTGLYIWSRRCGPERCHPTRRRRQ